MILAWIIVGSFYVLASLGAKGHLPDRLGVFLTSIVAISFSTYLFDGDNIVRRYIRESPASRQWEYFIFSLATLLVGAGAALCTWGQANSMPTMPGAQIPRDGPNPFSRYPNQIGDLLFAIEIATLAPLRGAVILVIGEALRNVRLILHLRENKSSPVLAGNGAFFSRAFSDSVQPVDTRSSALNPDWRMTFRHEAARWEISSQWWLSA